MTQSGGGVRGEGLLQYRGYEGFIGGVVYGWVGRKKGGERKEGGGSTEGRNVCMIKDNG